MITLENTDNKIVETNETAVGKQLHVAHIVLTLEIGGLERVVVDLVREGLALGQRVSVVALSQKGELASAIEAMGVPVICVDKPPGLKMKMVKVLGAVFRKMQPNVVHTHQIGALFYAGPAARSANVPVIVHTEHGKHFSRFRTRWLGRIAALYVARFFCVSEDLAEHVRSRWIMWKSKIQVVRNGIDTERFGPKEDEPGLRSSLSIPLKAQVVGTIGRLNEVKRQDLLLNAFAGVLKKMPLSHLLIVGDGPLKERLRSLAAELGIVEAVHFAGYQASPERFLQVMDVFALTSRSEGMPLALLEAGAAGLPVVATRVGGVPEVIEEGRTGLMVSSGNERELADALIYLLSDRSMAYSMGMAGKHRVISLFSLRRMAAEYQRHYWELLQRA